MSKKTTIYDIAKALNITAATVSRALNNNPRISEDTKKLVLETAEKLNYKQNRLALALKSGKSKNVGVVLPLINRNLFSNVIRGIEEELNPMGYNVIICQTHDEEKKEADIIQNLLDAQVDGIIISIARYTKNTKHLEQILKKNIPLIFFDRKLEIKGSSSVTLDDFRGAYEATQHLIEQGCTRIAHFTVDRSVDIYKKRFDGYKQALINNGIDFNEDYVIALESKIESGKEAAKKLMALKNPPDAIFSASDLGALGAIQYLRGIGIRIPQDFCVVGFSNEPFTQFMELTISTVDQAPILMGKTAAKVFLEQMKSEKVTIERRMVLSPSLKIRKSSSRTNHAE
ncbi:LacI family DNA-binding transcriptional regulator [Maribacter polysaccharolyticus]|uniref:LacI family DNA-binding transcriptional regulator n=1 Tax=Maribacter polysaccharolyticus TaxID=3020831 RepID=UPI00237F5B97|nr:LacI family DNA-binding transcriptional regulator [Maribacter polysaccharolyticus]MDE3742826.1 LacI family DNA-binding transcriptional regulator [Maribacter polysaccharolyticus]